MPIFHDPHESPPWRTVSRRMSSDEARRGGELKLDRDVSPLSGLHLDDATSSGMIHEPASHESRPTSQDRNQLIERIKRVKSPLWQLRQDVSS